VDVIFSIFNNFKVNRTVVKKKNTENTLRVLQKYLKLTENEHVDRALVEVYLLVSGQFELSANRNFG
jgi:hypothetical protein